jgi:arsenate reductase-like glutaredoxin family protein
MNKLYTFPNCSKCVDAANYLDKKKIEYQKVNTTISIGKHDFKEFYAQYKDSIQRDSQGIILPIFLYNSQVIQGLEKILEL